MRQVEKSPTKFNSHAPRIPVATRTRRRYCQKMIRPFLSAAAAALLTLAQATFAGDTAEGFRPWSAVEQPSLHDLAKGKIATSTNAGMKLDRGLSVQAIYLIAAPVETATQALLAFDSSKHPELGTVQHHRFDTEKDAAFDTLRLDPKVSACSALIRATRDPKKIQMSRDETARLPKNPSAESARQFLVSNLQQRWTSFFQTGELGGVRSHDARGEIGTLLGEEPKIAAHFSTLLAPLQEKTGAGKPVRSYWDLSEVDSVWAVGLGAIYLHATVRHRQVLDLTYFSSGGYLVSMALYEFQPITVNGKPATLVWQGILVSSPELAGGFGLRRQIGSRVMTGDVEKAIRALRKDAEKAVR